MAVVLLSAGFAVGFALGYIEGRIFAIRETEEED